MANETLRQERRRLQREALKRQRAANQTYQHAHVTVAKIAMELAGAYYDEQAHSDSFYNHWPDLDLFVQAEWHTFIPYARQVLGKMLADPTMPEAAREQVFEALVADRTLPRPDNVNWGAAAPIN